MVVRHDRRAARLSPPGHTRTPFGPSSGARGQPGLDVWGDGRGCNTLSGSFNVLTATYGPNNSIVQFDATFEQHCDGAIPALTGEIRYDATPTLTVGATIASSGTVKRTSVVATVSGTVSCSFPVAVNLSGTISEPAKKGTASAPLSLQVSCTGASTPWTFSKASTSGSAFVAGSAQVSVTATASDAFSGQQATTTASRSVSLSQVR